MERNLTPAEILSNTYKKYAIYISINENSDFSKYGFIKENDVWVLYKGIKRIFIYSDGRMRFNCLTVPLLAVFMEMIKNEEIYYKEVPFVPYNKRVYTFLTEEEFEMIKNLRNETK